MGDFESDLDKKKSHRGHQAGRKADKKLEKNKHVQELTAQQQNPKAFAFHSVVKAQRKFVRSQDIKSKKHHIPVVDRTPVEPPPVVVAVVGGPKVGKSTLLRCLIRNYTQQRLTSIQGPVTVVTGKKHRLTFIEVNNDINCMIDVAKIADTVLMLIDATFGIEMEVFEFLEVCRAHGSPRIMGVLNHLDMLKDNKALKKRKKVLKHRFQVELYPGAKMFYLSGIIHGDYLKNEVKNLGRFISVMKFRPLVWRSAHPYVLVDRWEDVTNAENIRVNEKCDRDLVLYGYVRGVPLQHEQIVHIPGCGDYRLNNVTFLPDPCPLPETLKKRSLNSKERLIYAPMSGVGGVVYDKDAVYIDLGGSHHAKRAKFTTEIDDEKEEIVAPLLNLRTTADEKRQKSKIQLMSGLEIIDNEDDDEEEEDEQPAECRKQQLPEFETLTDETGRVRRRAIFNDDLNDVSDEENSSDEEIEYLSNEEIESESDREYQVKKGKNDGDQLEKELEKLRQSDEAASSSNDRNLSCNISAQVVSRNADSAMVGKIRDILSRINETSRQKNPSICDISVTADDSGISDDETGEKVMSSDDENVNDIDDTEELEGNKINDEYRMEMFKQASSQFHNSQSSISYLRKFIYQELPEDVVEETADEEVGGMFRQVKNSFTQSRSGVTGFAIDAVDTSRYTAPIANDWNENELLEMIRDCFVTGEWKESEDAKTLLNLDDDDLNGDFEDLETGQKFESTENGMENEDALAINVEPKKEEKTAFEIRMEKKRRLKQMFDSEYDDKGDADYFTDLKDQMSQQAQPAPESHYLLRRHLNGKFNPFKSKEIPVEMKQLNRKEFEGLDETTRIEYEGFRPGLYVRMELNKMPCEFVTNFDATYPVIVGGLLDNENNMGFVRVRIKLHRWYPRILKNRDPLILSLGWRRFQTVMHYAKREDDFRMRSLKYARKYLHVEAMFWAPVCAVGTGFVALQNINDRVPEFRIAANGVVLETDHSTKIVKKLKLIGHPEKVLKKTAFIKGMFHSETEVAKFEGAKIQTQSAIRGLIKKSKGHNGIFRATFEDVIKLSDIVILKTWAPVELVKLCCTVCSLLLPPQEKAKWNGMRTVAQIKHDSGVKNLPNPDSIYLPITERREYITMPMRIPRQLQKSLPYNDKPKVVPHVKKPQRVLVVKDQEEVKIDNFMKRLKTMMEDKMKRAEMEKQEKKRQFKADIEKRESLRMMREKKKKAVVCKAKSMRTKKM